MRQPDATGIKGDTESFLVIWCFYTHSDRSVRECSAMSTAENFSESKAYFELFSALKKGEVKTILKTLKKKKKLINCFAEFALNFCVLGGGELTVPEKKHLRKFKRAILIIADKRNSLQSRNQVLEGHPQLVKSLSSLILAKLWPSQ